MKKRIVSIILSVAMVFSLAISASAAGRYYTDVSTTASYYDAVNYLYEHGVMVGTGNNTFSPSDGLTRGALVTIMWAMVNKPDPDGTTTSFTDVSSSAYYYDAIRWASSSNVGAASGNGDGTFSPDKVVTQQDALVFLYSFMKYCGYISNSTATNNSYLSAFNNSSLTYKSSFSDYAKTAAGWAYSVGMIQNSLSPQASCVRSTFASYVYKIYCTYQDKYALTVVNTSNMSYASACGTAMATLFTHDGATCISKTDIAKSTFASAMSSAFSNAKRLDICYLFFQSHGSNSGLSVFTDGVLTPTNLRNQIDQYKGTFVVFVSGCDSGTYIASSESTEEAIGEEVNNEIVSEEADGFDADAFVKALVGVENLDEAEANLTGSKNIKVLCSSMKDELSYSAITRAVKYWCLGAGYDLTTEKFTTLYADSDSNNRISLEELYTYSYNQIIQLTPQQHIVCYPENSGYIILESGY